MTSLRRVLLPGAVAFGLVYGVLPSAVHAQDPPCTEEIRTVCAGVQPGGGRILQCLKANEAKLSPVCAKRLDNVRAVLSGPVGAACRDDWAALCYHPKVSTDRQSMLQCLQENRAKVSPGCQKALQSAGSARQQPRGVTP